MGKQFTEVSVTQQSSPKAVLLANGTGTSNDSRLETFACGKFNPNDHPMRNEKYDISALDKSGVRIQFSGECTFSGETSQFKRLG